MSVGQGTASRAVPGLWSSQGVGRRFSSQVWAQSRLAALHGEDCVLEPLWDCPPDVSVPPGLAHFLWVLSASSLSLFLSSE